MQIYLARNNQQAGPYSLDELNSMMSDGQVELTDLAWHQGMNAWQPLGELTSGMTYYNGIAPNSVTSADNDDSSNNSNHHDSHNPSNNEQTNETTDTTNNPDNKKPDNKVGALSLSSTTSNERSQAYQQAQQQADNNNTPAWQQPKQPQQTRRKTDVVDTPATKGQRFSATMLDFALFLGCFIPVLGHMSLPKSLDPNMTLNQQMAMVQGMIEKIPPSAVTFTNVATFVFLVLQIILLVKRGQSIGKGVVGIRVVDASSKKLASATTVVFKRFIPSCIVFYLLLLFAGPLAFVFYGMFIWLNKDGQLPHDKLAKTLVYKATNNQVDSKK